MPPMRRTARPSASSSRRRSSRSATRPSGSSSTRTSTRARCGRPSYALTELTAADEKRIVALVKKAARLDRPSWGAIEVRGARENNLRNVSLDIPKRRLTVFTGVSGSGKSSLVFDTIAAESQRLINETYSAFVQGFMPNLARPDVDSLEGLTTAIVLDQERMGANAALHRRHGHRRQRAAARRLQPRRRGRTSAARRPFAFNVPSVRGSGAITVERGGGQTAAAELQRRRRDVPALRGHGHRQRHRPERSSTTRRKSLNEGAIGSPATRQTAGRRGCSASRASSTRTSRSATTARRSSTTSCTRSRPRSGSTAST